MESVKTMTVKKKTKAELPEIKAGDKVVYDHKTWDVLQTLDAKGKYIVINRPEACYSIEAKDVKKL